jgi:acetyltransferase-like isoleucine patch superfamily enzyme
MNEAIFDLLKSKNILFLSSGYHKDISIKIGDVFIFDDELELYPHTTFMTGNALFNMGVFSYSRSELGGDNGRSNVQRVRIGRYCSIADNVRIFQSSHLMTRYTTSNLIDTYPSYHYESKQIKARELEKGKIRNFSIPVGNRYVDEPVKIGNDVWIGSHVALKPGITIGDGACIGTGAIVTKNIPPYAVVAGAPQKIIRYRFDDKIIEKLLSLKWWDYDFLDFKAHPDEPIESFIEKVSEQIIINEIQFYQPIPLTAKDILALKDK